jgi:hypothetical protein
MVAVTHYLDSSNVYGSSQQVADSIREFQGGRLRVELKYGRQFPPSNNNKSALCDHVTESEACYLAGLALRILTLLWTHCTVSVCSYIWRLQCSKVRILQHDLFRIHRTASNYARYEVTTQVSIKTI